jgi:hypothetical protein
MALLKIHLLPSLLLPLLFGASPVPQEKPIPDDTLITLQRTVCFGACPDYKLTITADGTVTFEGREFVKVKRTVKGRISRDDLRSLIAAFEAASYFSLNDSYSTQKDGCPEVWTDNPTAVTSIRMNGKTKTISHYYGCQTGSGTSVYPNALTYLETQIDQIVGTEKWIK